MCVDYDPFRSRHSVYDETKTRTWEWRMERRELIAGLCVLATWSCTGLAQPAARRYRLGMLDTSPRAVNSNFSKLLQAPEESGFVEGENLTIDYRSAACGNEAFVALARDLTERRVDVIVTRATPAALAARAATTTLPVVMAAAGDPLAIARSRERPALNMTGFGAYATGAEAKRLAVLKQMLP